MTFLKAVPPSLEQGHDTIDRLAARVAFLFGVEAAEAPGGLTWLMQYDALTLTEIARGGPLPSQEWHERVHPDARKRPRRGESDRLPRRAGDVTPAWWLVNRALVLGTGEEGLLPMGGARLVSKPHEIAAATLNRFRPDRKAAVVLAGTNRLLESVVPTIEDVAGVVRLTSPRLDRRMWLALWAGLVQEVYRCQPALFIAAWQARAVQRALSVSWGALPKESSDTVRGEYGSKELGTVDDELLSPRRLAVLDDSLPLFLPAAGDVAGEDSDVSLFEEVTHMWSTHLLDSPDSGVGWWTQDENGQRTAHAFMSTQEAIAALASTKFRSVRMNVAEAIDSLLPAVPTADQLLDLPQASREATCWSLTQLLRVARNEQLLKGSIPEDRKSWAYFRREATRRMAQVKDITRDVLGEAHPLTYWAINRHAVFEHQDEKNTDVAIAANSVDRVLDTLARLSELYHGRVLESSFYAEALITSSVEVRFEAGSATARGDRESARELYGYLTWLWGEAFAAMQVDIDAELDLALAGSGSDAVDSLASHLHNYAAVLADAEDIAIVERALAIQDELVIPSRVRTAHVRHNERALRLAIQVFLRCVDGYLQRADVEAARRVHWAGRARARVAQLEALSSVAALLDVDAASSPNTTDLNTLAAVVAGRLMSAESSLATPGSVNLLGTQRLLELLARAWDPDAENAAEPRTADQARVRGLFERLYRLGSIRPKEVLAEASSVAVWSETQDGGGFVASAVFESDTLFQALRGVHRQPRDERPTVSFLWREQSGVVEIDMVQPFLSPSVASVVVEWLAEEHQAVVPLTWQHRYGEPVRLRGELTAEISALRDTTARATPVRIRVGGVASPSKVSGE